jgi:hygromycin-B 4-O-kinase
VFDWSQNKLSKNRTWINFLDVELAFDERMKILKKENILTPPNCKKLLTLYEKVKKWKIAPALNHGDLRLKNVIADNSGKIIAIIDWDNCISNVAPYWDLSIALHDLSIDGKHRFLEGYGVDFDEFDKMAYSMKVFNIINYADSIKAMKEKNDLQWLQYYRLRLNGDLDLYSL